MRISQVFGAWENTLAGSFGGNLQIVQEGVATPLGRDHLTILREVPHLKPRGRGSPESKKRSSFRLPYGSFAHCASLFSGDVISSTEV